MQVAIREPVGDHDNERILGTSDDGFADTDSENSTGFSGLNTFGNVSFFSGFERIGAIEVEAVTAGSPDGNPLS